MRFNKFVLSGLTALASLGMASEALADGRNPGALLLFPEYDNRDNDLTLLTVTNTNADVNTEVDVEFIYIGRFSDEQYHNQLDCLEFNRTHRLTANDTLSLITSHHNPQGEQGFVYAFAKDVDTGAAIPFNWLIGNAMTINGIETIEYSMNPLVFLGIGDGVVTDLDGDNIRDLDNVEYEQGPDQVLVPRFLASGGGFKSELILIGLSGGAAFDTIAGFLIYNDNEEVFSAQYQFRCWDRVKLKNINGVFTQQFLEDTNHDEGEIIGATGRESGWFRLYGQTAYSTAEQINDPLVYGVLIEKVDNYGAADLPFELGLQSNGDLFPVGIFGDGPNPENGDNQ